MKHLLRLTRAQREFISKRSKGLDLSSWYLVKNTSTELIIYNPKMKLTKTFTKNA